MRRAWKALLVLLLAVLVLLLTGVAWVYLFTGTPLSGTKLTLKDVAVTSIELSWLSTKRTITASGQCTQVIQTMGKARQHTPPASPAFGTLTLYYADGTTNRFYLSPSGRVNGLELVGESGGYAISMGEMLGTFESVGLLTEDWK